MSLGLVGLPHSDVIGHAATSVMSALNINLDQFDGFESGGGRASPGAGAALVPWLSIMVLQVLFACLYKSNVHDKKEPIKAGDQTMQNGYHFGLFSCHQNVNDCLCVFFCGAVRYADAFGSVTGSFWGALCTYIGVGLICDLAGVILTPILYPASRNPFDQHAQMNGAYVRMAIEMVICGLFFGLVARKALRQKLGDPAPGGSAFTDCLAWGACSCCALVQDAVEVDIALNVTVGCPCSVTPGRMGLNAREVAPSDYEALLLEGGR